MGGCVSQASSIVRRRASSFSNRGSLATDTGLLPCAAVKLSLTCIGGIARHSFGSTLHRIPRWNTRCPGRACCVFRGNVVKRWCVTTPSSCAAFPKIVRAGFSCVSASHVLQVQPLTASSRAIASLVTLYLNHPNYHTAVWSYPALSGSRVGKNSPN